MADEHGRWSPTARARLGTEESMPDASFESIAKNVLPSVSLAEPSKSFGDYLFRLFFSFKALLASQLLVDFKSAAVRDSDNLYRVAKFDRQWEALMARVRQEPCSSAMWSHEARLLVHSFNSKPFEFTPEDLSVSDATSRSMDMDEDDENDHTGSSCHTNNPGVAEGSDSLIGFWESLFGPSETNRGVRGLAMLVWLGSGSTPIFRGCNIVRVEEVASSSVKLPEGERMFNVVIRVTESFAKWFDHAGGDMPSPDQICLLDPRLVGAEAVLRVLEGLAVEASKQCRNGHEVPFSVKAPGLGLPAWAVHSGTDASQLVASANRVIAVPKVSLMGLCAPEILPNLLTTACSGRVSVDTMAFQSGSVGLTLSSQNQNSSWKTVVDPGINYLAGSPQPYPAQQFAIVHALLRPLTLVVGPPGTGKTDTVGWSLLTLCENLCRVRHEQIFILAHSNKALDQMVLRLLALYDIASEALAKQSWNGQQKNDTWTPSIVRLGYTDSIHGEVNRRCSINAAMEKTRAPTYGGWSYSERRSDVLNRADVIAMTCAGAAIRRFGFLHHRRRIGAMVVEEAAKVTQSCMFAMLSYNPDRCIMIGDSMQLAPVIRNEYVKMTTRLDLSLFERIQLMGVRPIQLDRQGRARPEICNLYRWRYPTLMDLPSVCCSGFFGKPPLPGQLSPSELIAMDFIDLPRGHTDGEVCLVEATSVARLISLLVNVYKVESTNISVITPYCAQRNHLRSSLRDLSVAHIATVDEFQGLQNDIIIISLTHRGKRPSVFLRDPRRVNVMTSRAKRSVFFVGRRSTYEADDQWSKILNIIDIYIQREKRGTDGTPIFKTWNDELISYGLRMKASDALNVPEEYHGLDAAPCEASDIGKVLLGRVQRVCLDSNVKIEAAERITGFLLNHIESSSAETRHQILSSSKADFTSTVIQLAQKLF